MEVLIITLLGCLILSVVDRAIQQVGIGVVSAAVLNVRPMAITTGLLEVCGKISKHYIK